MLEFSILGPLEVASDERVVRLGGPKQRAVLAILLLNANRVVSVERLADDLYAGAPPVTAVTQVQRQVSELRKALGPTVIETRSPGYVLHVERERLDLDRFERWLHEAAQAFDRSDHASAVDLATNALALWRGSPLADVAYEPFAQTAIARLEELRLAALEQRFEAELALGRDASALGELEALVWDNPLRERLRALLMLALYRSGRQADALEVYRAGREVLVDELGIEPSRALAELQSAILRQDPALDLSEPERTRVETERVVLVASFDDERLDALLAAAPIDREPGRALLLARLLTDESELGQVAQALDARRVALDAPTRAAAFTSLEPARDIVRLATNYGVELVLLDAPPGLDDERLPGDFAAIAERSPADVAALSGPAPDWRRGDGVFVPFGGADHDWAALALGAQLAVAAQAPLRLVGTRADPARGLRDASRLLADASLATQRVVGVAAAPVLADANEHALLAALAPASVVVAGLPTRWRAEGLGSIRRALVRAGAPPLLLVHRGMRPGVLAPRESLTRFSWSLEPIRSSSGTS